VASDQKISSFAWSLTARSSLSAVKASLKLMGTGLVALHPVVETTDVRGDIPSRYSIE
jgi:hypothetical protein